MIMCLFCHVRELFESVWKYICLSSPWHPKQTPTENGISSIREYQASYMPATLQDNLKKFKAVAKLFAFFSKKKTGKLI